MTINLRKGLIALLASGIFASANAASGWPAQYEGVMLQGFFWDSYSGTNNTKWSTLTSQADELSSYFKLIWVPNSAKAASSPSMGYDPVYWFTQHNSSFGTRSELNTMISTFKEKGTGIIADVVINHRSGVSNWTNFPAEPWRGKVYQLGPQHICSTDEVKNQSGQANPTGAPDTGEDFNGARDLDHTHPEVQEHCMAYCQCLLEDLGYVGFRLDMTKGYGAQYTKMYNEYANPTYCVGEYWDGSYDALASWINGTGKTSAAFDFAFKYAVNDAFANKNYSKLCWKANGIDQPAGLIHYGYQRYAVTFIDNHDTCRDDWNKFNGNVLAANAYMLSCPGTPCVFIKHWQQYKEQLKPMIAARNEAGIHNESSVRVISCNNGIYMAEVTGKHGKLAVKIGSQMVSPDGYSDNDIRCTGTDYCIWVKSDGGQGGGGGHEDPSYPQNMYLIGNLQSGNWSTSKSESPESKADGVYTWNNVTLLDSGDGNSYFSFVTRRGADWNEVNTSDRYGATTKDEAAKKGDNSLVLYPANVNSSSAYSWKTSPGVHSFTIDLKRMKMVLDGGSGVLSLEDGDDVYDNSEYYDLTGRRITNPGSGLYIKVCKGKVTKEYIR